MNPRFTHIILNRKTKDRLNQLKVPGQSYDGLLRQLMDIVESMMPMPPAKGPPLPRSWGVTWPKKEEANNEYKQR